MNDAGGVEGLDSAGGGSLRRVSRTPASRKRRTGLRAPVSRSFSAEHSGKIVVLSHQQPGQ